MSAQYGSDVGDQYIHRINDAIQQLNDDINQFLDIKEYNLLITEDINEFDESSLISYIENLWPLAYEENEISFLVEHYFKYLIYLDNVNIANDKLYLVGLIIKKNYKLNQKITCTNPNLSNIIKSFIDTI